MPATHNTLAQAIQCPCGRWEFRETVSSSSTGTVAIDRKCPKCSQWYVLVLRVEDRTWSTKVLGIVAKLGADEGSYRQALSNVSGLKTDEVDRLVLVARSLQSSAEHGRAA